MQTQQRPCQARLAVECLEDRRPLSVTPLTLTLSIPVTPTADEPSPAALRTDGDSDQGDQKSGKASGDEKQAEEREADDNKKLADTATDKTAHATHAEKLKSTVDLTVHPVAVRGATLTGGQSKESRAVVSPVTAAVAEEGVAQATTAAAAPAKEVQASTLLPRSTDLSPPAADLVREQDRGAVAEQQPAVTNLVAVPTTPDTHARRTGADSLALLLANPQAQTFAWPGPGNDVDTGVSPGRGSAAEAEVAVVASKAAEEGDGPVTSQEVGDSTVSGLLSAGVPFDIFSLDRGVDGFLQRLDQLGERLGLSLGSVPVHSWLVAAALSAVAVESARRQFRSASASRSRLLHGADAADTLTWSLTLAQ
jgi:hypothetical protein